MSAGLEDFALESILRTLHTYFHVQSDIFLEVSACLLSGHVIVRFPGPVIEAQENMRRCIACYATGDLVAVESAFLIAADELAEESRALLHVAFLEKLRVTDALGPRRRRDQSQISPRSPQRHPAEEIFLADIERTFSAAYPNMSLAFTLISNINHTPQHQRTFRGSVSNPSRFLPLPTLNTKDIERSVGDCIAPWLEKHHSPHGSDFETQPEWRVDLVHPQLDVHLRLIGVPNKWTTRCLSPSSTPCEKRAPVQHNSQHISQPEFPHLLRMLIALAIPAPSEKVIPSILSPLEGGRTALIPSTAHLLSCVHPFFSPFLPLLVDPDEDLQNTRKDNETLKPGAILLDPFAGTGSIPFHILALAHERGIPITVLCADNQPRNIQQVHSSIHHHSQQSSTLKTVGDGIQYMVSDARGAFRSGTVDGIITDLPYGHRELSHRTLTKLYPAFLRNVARCTKSGAYLVLATAAAPVLRRSLAALDGAWFQEVFIGGTKEREVFVGGMRVWVFLLVRTGVPYTERPH